MRLTLRFTLLFFVLFGLHIASSAVSRYSRPRNVQLPDTDLSELPRRLGDWKCNGTSEQHAGPQVTEGADVRMHRVYENGEGFPVSTYAAVWTEYDERLPHLPQRCYPVAGMSVVSTDDASLHHADGTHSTVQLLHVNANDEPGYVLYWYQLENHVVCDDSRSRNIVYGWRGRKQWPPLVKVMLDIRGVDEAHAKRLLVDLGERILEWTSTLR